MDNLAVWQAQRISNPTQYEGELVLFLAYKPESEAQANAAGMEYMGTTWDVNGIRAKAYKPASDRSRAHRCVTCGSQAKPDQGVYCCGRKRVVMS